MPYHLPGHNWAGPGTDILQNFAQKKIPVNNLDFQSFLHDIAYWDVKKSTEEADSEYIQRLNSDPTLIAKLAQLTFVGKKLVDGYILDTDYWLRPERYSYKKGNYASHQKIWR